MAYYEKAKERGEIERAGNGVECWPVPSRFGNLWAVGDGSRAFRDLSDALDYAETINQGSLI